MFLFTKIIALFFTHLYCTVVLSSVEVLNDLLSKNEATGRPDHGVYFDRQEVPNTGVGKVSIKHFSVLYNCNLICKQRNLVITLAMSVGESWKTKVNWMNKAFREVGIGRTSDVGPNFSLARQLLKTTLTVKFS